MNGGKDKNKDFENIQRIVRLRPDYIKVCSYLDFVSRKNEKDIGDFYNDIFIYSLDYISKNGFNYYITPYKPRRTPKGLKMSRNTSSSINSAYSFVSSVYKSQHSKKLYIAEFVELLIYIYVNNKLSLIEIESIGIDFGIRRLE